MKCANPNCNRGMVWYLTNATHSTNGDSVQRNAATSLWTRSRNGSNRNFIPRATSSGFCRDRPRI
jgi:hypothetical protein